MRTIFMIGIYISKKVEGSYKDQTIVRHSSYTD